MNMACCNGGYHEFNLDWFIKRFNEIQTEWDGTKEWLKNWVDSFDISGEVKKVMQEWVDDGTFERLINEVVLNDINEKVDSLEQELNTEKETIDENTANIAELKTLGLQGKNVAFFGDSLTYGELIGTGGQQAPNNYPATFAKMTGANVTNYGRSGDKATDCLEKIKEVKADLINYQMIFVNIGVNDFLSQTDVGWLDCTEETYFNGQINAIFNELQSARSGDCQVIALSFMPNHEMWNEWFDKVSWLTYKANFDYCATVNGIPIINMAKAVGISEFNSGKYMAPDGLHFTDDGYKLLGKTIVSCMMSGYYYDIRAGFYTENQIKPWTFENTYNTNVIRQLGALYRNGLLNLTGGSEKDMVNQCAYLADEFTFLFTSFGGPATVGLGFPGYPRLGKINVRGTGRTYLIKSKNTVGENTFLGWAIQATGLSSSNSLYISNMVLKYGSGEFPGFAEENHFDVNISFESGVSSDVSQCRVIQKDFEIQLNGYFYNTSRAIPPNTNILNLKGFPWVRRENTCKTYLVYCGGNDGKMYVFNCESGYLVNLTQIPQGVIIGLNAVLYL